MNQNVLKMFFREAEPARVVKRKVMEIFLTGYLFKSEERQKTFLSVKLEAFFCGGLLLIVTGPRL